MRERESSLYRLHLSRILSWSRGRNWVQSGMRALETSLFQPYVIRIFVWSKGAKWVQSAMQELESSIQRRINFSQGTLNPFCAFRSDQNATCVRLKKRSFKGWHCTLNSFSASWLAQNASCVRLDKQSFKGFEIWPFTSDLELCN